MASLPGKQYISGAEGDSLSALPDGTMRKLTDVSKLHSLGWKHRVELEEGVERIYRWYLSRMEADGN